MEIWDGTKIRPIRSEEVYETERKPNKVICPLTTKEGDVIFETYRDNPFNIKNKWLVLKVDDINRDIRDAFCVLLYSHRHGTPGHFGRHGTPGQTTNIINLLSLPRNYWRTEV